MMARALRYDNDDAKFVVEIEARGKKVDCRIGIRTSIIGRLLAINNRRGFSIGRQRKRERETFQLYKTEYTGCQRYS